jgi:hypothetical protein
MNMAAFASASASLVSASSPIGTSAGFAMKCFMTGHDQ